MNKPSIDDLVADLQPVKRLSARGGVSLTGVALGVAILCVASVWGLRADLMIGDPPGIVMIRGGSLLLLGCAALIAVIGIARPAVGQVNSGWKWALAGAALFPIASLTLMMKEGALPMAALTASSAPWCLAISGMSALLIGSVLTAWLRKGAPTVLPQAGWLVGLTAGAFGTFAYSLHCPSDTVHYIGIWYTLAVAACAGLGRLLVPPLIRW
jgi:hypothetical protein